MVPLRITIITLRSQSKVINFAMYLHDTEHIQFVIRNNEFLVIIFAGIRTMDGLNSEHWKLEG